MSMILGPRPLNHADNPPSFSVLTRKCSVDLYCGLWDAGMVFDVDYVHMNDSVITDADVENVSIDADSPFSLFRLGAESAREGQ